MAEVNRTLKLDLIMNSTPIYDDQDWNMLRIESVKNNMH